MILHFNPVHTFPKSMFNRETVSSANGRLHSGADRSAFNLFWLLDFQDLDYVSASSERAGTSLCTVGVM